MIKLAIVRPGGDRIADEARSWGQRLRSSLAAHPSVSIAKDLDTARDADLAAVDQCLQDANVALFYCHGRANSLYHTGGIMADGDYVRANGHITIVAMACYSALEFAPKAILKGVRAYLGFSEKVYFVMRPGNSHAALTGDAWNYGVLSYLVRRASLRQAEDDIKDKLAEMIDRFRDPGDLMREPDSYLAFSWAHWNMQHLCIEGDGGALADGSRRGILPPNQLYLRTALKQVVRSLNRLMNRL